MKSTSTDFVLKYLELALLLASKFINILQVCTPTIFAPTIFAPTIFAPTIFAPTIFAVGLALEKKCNSEQYIIHLYLLSKER